MARIPYFDTSKAQGRAAKAYEKLPALNIFRMLGHSGELVDGFNRMGSQLLYFTKLETSMHSNPAAPGGVPLTPAATELPHVRPASIRPTAQPAPPPPG